MELNHNVVPASAGEDDVWEFRPGRNSVGVRKIDHPVPKVAVNGNLGLEVGTPLVLEIRSFFSILKGIAL